MKLVPALAAALALTLAVAVPASAKTSKSAAPTIAQIAVGDGQFDANGGDFDVLADAVVKLGLAPALSGKKQYTVFAPNDAAFAKLVPAGTPESAVATALVGALGEDVVRDVVLYHVAKGRRDAAAVLESPTIRMLNGDRTTISLRSGVPYIDDSQIIATDVFASNGVVHVIDSVLLP